MRYIIKDNGGLVWDGKCWNHYEPNAEIYETWEDLPNWLQDGDSEYQIEIYDHNDPVDARYYLIDIVDGIIPEGADAEAGVYAIDDWEDGRVY